MKNKFKIIGDTVVIHLKHKGKQLVTTIDLADFEKVDSVNGTWGARHDPDINNYYVKTAFIDNGKPTYIQLHRFLCDAPEGMVVDHKNRNTLDNRRSRNLRVMTDAENKQNTKRRKTGSSRYRGVYWNKRSKKWHAKLGLNGKQKFLGAFDNEIEAARAAQEARLKYMPYTVETEILA